MKYIHVTKTGINCIEVNGFIPIEDVLKKLVIPNKEYFSIELNHFSHRRKVIIRDKLAKFNNESLLGVTRKGEPIYGEFIICWLHYNNNDNWQLAGMSDAAIDITLREILLVNQ